MANITAADVMKLRKMTSAGMMDCKKALIEADGDSHSFCLGAVGQRQVTFATSGPQRGRKGSKPAPFSALRYFESVRLTTA